MIFTLLWNKQFDSPSPNRLIRTLLGSTGWGTPVSTEPPRCGWLQHVGQVKRNCVNLWVFFSAWPPDDLKNCNRQATWTDFPLVEQIFAHDLRRAVGSQIQPPKADLSRCAIKQTICRPSLMNCPVLISLSAIAGAWRIIKQYYSEQLFCFKSYTQNINAQACRFRCLKAKLYLNNIKLRIDMFH